MLCRLTVRPLLPCCEFVDDVLVVAETAGACVTLGAVGDAPFADAHVVP